MTLTKVGFPEIPAHYIQSATELLKEHIKIKASLVISRTDLSFEQKEKEIEKIFIWNSLGNSLSYFLQAVEYGAVDFDNDRKCEPDFEG